MILYIFLLWKSFCFCKYLLSISSVHQYFTFGSHLCSSIFMTTNVFFVWQTYFFFIISANYTWNCRDICVYKSTNTHEVLSDSLKYFTSISHICPFSSMFPLAFLFFFGSHFFANAYEDVTAIHKYIIFAATFVVWHLWAFIYFLFGRHISSNWHLSIITSMLCNRITLEYCNYIT